MSLPKLRYFGVAAYELLHANGRRVLVDPYLDDCPGNPVKSDARSARPAGSLFERDGALYRPAQICAPLYGSGVSLNRVLQLSPQAYVEQEDERIVATHPAGLLGMHTLNRAGELSVLDAFVRRRRLGKAALGGSEFARSIPNTSAIAARASSRYFEV